MRPMIEYAQRVWRILLEGSRVLENFVVGLQEGEPSTFSEDPLILPSPALADMRT